jgi:hypothetical protein
MHAAAAKCGATTVEYGFNVCNLDLAIPPDAVGACRHGRECKLEACLARLLLQQCIAACCVVCYCVLLLAISGLLIDPVLCCMLSDRTGRLAWECKL